ncbi:uncharacterized protein LOC123897485 [Trifolium pratense]|uniref:uncharacterized protein LOC123897485 n=1 Tax=Trifolium pratense TaxID=57577 RepID=UPI001E692482|nr:uncharacterized protein LOC123897485 [Trifolium pratense]
MGCISSKLIIARSISYHEERNQRSKANSIPLLEELIISTSGSDQYLAALVCTANKLSNKLHSKSLSSNTTSKLAIEPESSEVIDENLEHSTILEAKLFESDQKNRSKSWHFPEHIAYSLSQESSSSSEDKDDLRSKSDLGSRSFHTVEEYDDIVNRIWLSKSQIVQRSDYNDDDNDDDSAMMTTMTQVSECTSNATHHTQNKDSTIKKMQPLCLNKNEKVIQSHKTKVLEKGNKRKDIAKRLESLIIPSNVESPAIATLRKWLPADGIYSPSSYVTPKFGSYSSTNIRNENEDEASEDSIFSQELVSAFEQCMQKLEAEEENILKQILENVEEEIDEGMKN